MESILLTQKLHRTHSIARTLLPLSAILWILFVSTADGYNIYLWDVNCHYFGCCDSASVTYEIAPIDSSCTLASGTYWISSLKNGVFNGLITVTIGASRNITCTAGWEGYYLPSPLFNDPWGPPTTIKVNSDGNLYSDPSCAPKYIVGTVSGEISLSWGNGPCIAQGDCEDSNGDYIDGTYPNTLLYTINGQCRKDSATIPGQSTQQLDSLHASFGLGTGTNYFGGAKLDIVSESAVASLATPAFLIVQSSGELWTHSDNNGLRQVMSGDVLADILTNGPYQYSINFYEASNAGSTNSSGLYQPTGSPFKTATIENPDSSTNFNRLWITTVEGNATNQWQYSYSTNSLPYSNYWTLLCPASLRKETLTTVWTTNFSSKVTIRDVYTPGSPDVLVYQELDSYTDFGWGPVRTRQVLGTNGVLLTNTWAYYTNSAQTGSYQNAQQMTKWNGYWEQYQYNSSGQETNRLCAYQNAPLASSGSSCRAIVTSYSTSAPNVTQVETILGQEVGRTYTAFYSASNAVQVVKCQTTNASFTAANNLVTTTCYDSFYRPLKVFNADGTISFYTYFTNSDNSITTTNTVGQPNSGGTAVAEGTQAITVVGSSGQMISNIVFYVTGSSLGAVLQQDYYSYDSSDYAHRSPTITHLDGTTTTERQGCCGMPLLGNTVDKDGTTNYFVYDGLQRTISSTIDSVTTTNIYDGYGNIVAVERIGSDTSVITNQQDVYDLADRLIAETNALGDATTYSITINSSGQVVKTTTYADSSTRVETCYLDGTLQSVTGTAVFPARYTNGIVTDGGVPRAYNATIKLDASGNDTAECSTNFLDMLGRVYKTAYASASGSPASISYFNSLGQLTNQVDPDGVSTLYQYDGKGELVYTATDINGNGTIDFSGTDRIAANVSDVVADNGTNVRRTRRYVWEVNSSNTSNLVSTVETSVDGLRTWNIVWNGGVGATNFSQTVYIPADGYRLVTNTAPDGSYSVTTNIFGRIISVTGRDSGGNQISQSIYGYDVHGRQNTVTDARDGTATNFYNNADQVNGAASPSPDGVQAAQVTTNYFDSMGRIIITTLPDNTSVTNVYLSNGLLQQTSGSRTYPVGYSYDAQGRMRTMTNWSGFGSGAGARVTTWNYDGYRGFLTNKTYDGGAAGPGYGYTMAGRLQARIWARGITTTYGYDVAGDLQSVVYSDGTSGITNGFDRVGRKINVTNGGAVCTLVYNDPGELLSESYAGGPLDGLTVTNIYDQFLRRTNLALNSQLSTLSSTAYGYDAVSRLLSVADGTNSATYSYVANSPFVSQIVFTNSGTLRMTTTKSYDYLNRLTSIQSSAGASTVASFSYANNLANQRTSVTNVDNSYWVYQYDSLGQVTSGKKYWSDGTPVAGQQFTYKFDDIGNRTNAAFGGDQTGANLRLANYTNNTLNQLTSRDVPGYANILGEATNTAAVYVNYQIPYRRTNYFREELATNNTASALWFGVTNLAVLSNSVTTDITSTNSGNIFLAQTPEQFGYDADGNLTNDGRWSYYWDAENRLTNMTSQSTAPLGSKLKLDFLYDYQGRRIQKLVSTNNGSSYVAEYTNRFAYDGWNLIATLNPQSSILQSFEWGLDLSGSMQGAGGVGGLLEVSEIANSQITNCFAAYDGNGNVAALLNASDGAATTQYQYGPFGEVIRASGPLAKANPVRFSTKYQDNESDILWYGCRYFCSVDGRWLIRDLIEEEGGLNLYGIVRNDIVDSCDYLGYSPCCTGPTWGKSGTFQTVTETTSGHSYVRYYLSEPNWFDTRKDQGKPCSCQPANATMSRTDKVHWRSIDMSVNISWTGGPYKDAVLLWFTCYRPNGTAGYIPKCVNSLTCTFKPGFWRRYWDNYVTGAELTYLSCENGVWTLKGPVAATGNYNGGLTGWTFTQP